MPPLNTSSRYDRRHVLEWVDRANINLVDARHQLGIRGVGQKKRYERILKYLERVISESRLAYAAVALLVDATEES